MKSIVFFALFSAVSTVCFSQSTPAQRLDSLFEAYHEFILEQFPESASLNGDHRYDDRLTDYSSKARRARLTKVQQMLSYAQEFSAADLSREQLVNRDLFVWSLQEWLKSDEWEEWLIPMSQQNGIQLDFPLLAEQTRFASETDTKNYLARLHALPEQIDQIIDLMKQGISREILPAKSVMKRVEEQLQALCEKPLNKQSFYTVLVQDEAVAREEGSTLSPDLKAVQDPGLVPPEPPKVMGEGTKTLLTKECELVVKAYRKLWSFVQDVYLPKCRTDDGMWSLPKGKARYERALHDHTSLDLNSNEVFELGEREVARIEQQMHALSKKLRAKGSLREFHEQLRTSPEYYYTSKEQMLDEYRSILSKATSGLPLIFEKLPKTPCEVKELESYREENAPQAYYYGAPNDNSRPGYFYVNCSHLKMRPKYTMTALTLHEAVPGHHLQISLAQENKSIPWFRRELSVTSFVEGWALYAESLGDSLGLYTDPLQRYGSLGFELWRAARLVVDAGIHAKHWTRDQAIQYMMAHTINSEHDIVSEVERYIAWPGQACAYKIGQLKLLELRSKAQQKLGSKFSLKAFHNCLLENGSLPLPLLEKHVEEWITAHH